MIPTIKFTPFKNKVDFLLWGYWYFKKGAKGQPVKQLIINSRNDTILRELANPKKIYHKALSTSRLIVPAQSFYEWPVIDGVKKKTEFKVEGEEMFSMGGFETSCQMPDGSWISTAVIITTHPTEQMTPYHDRMPLIIPKSREADWLQKDETTSEEFLRSFFDTNKPNLLIG